jgi:hypothetical protein
MQGVRGVVGGGYCSSWIERGWHRRMDFDRCVRRTSRVGP